MMRSAIRNPNRQHFNADGTPKRGWATRVEAVAALRAVSSSHVHAYHCTMCDMWHHGHTETNGAKRIVSKRERFRRKCAEESIVDI
jgi:hypothetical protein